MSLAQQLFLDRTTWSSEPSSSVCFCACGGETAVPSTEASILCTVGLIGCNCPAEKRKKIVRDRHILYLLASEVHGGSLACSDSFVPWCLSQAAGDPIADLRADLK